MKSASTVKFLKVLMLSYSIVDERQAPQVAALVRRQACLARLLFYVSQLLLRGVQGLLLAVDLRLLFAAVFGKLGLVAQLGAGIGVKSGRAQALFALHDIEFALQPGNLVFLRLDLVGQLIALLRAGVR